MADSDIIVSLHIVIPSISMVWTVISQQKKNKEILEKTATKSLLIGEWVTH